MTKQVLKLPYKIRLIVLYPCHNASVLRAHNQEGDITWYKLKQSVNIYNVQIFNKAEMTTKQTNVTDSGKILYHANDSSTPDIQSLR